jgi:hypothetical protein
MFCPWYQQPTHDTDLARSVSTGFGATDDGMGVVSCLQTIRHFTSRDQKRPARGIVVLLNNEEEGMLWGARAFGHSPLLPFITTFVNLDGAGAGGRAVMFRSTDRQVSEAYAHSPHPFGSVIGNDAFKLGAIRSDTDYHIWDGVYGQRGIDIAFYAPRNLYHTRKDLPRYTSPDSIVHMLSATIATTAEMANDKSGGRFHGPRPDGDRNKAQNGRADAGVWFDLFGAGFAVFGLDGLFAWVVTLLVASPIVLALVTYLLVRQNRYYFAARVEKIQCDNDDGEARVPIGGLKGMFGFPLSLIVAVAVNMALVVLVATVNPLIVSSSEYSVYVVVLPFSLSNLITHTSVPLTNHHSHSLLAGPCSCLSLTFRCGRCPGQRTISGPAPCDAALPTSGSLASAG